MAEITASMIKELRNRTQAGMLDCKKALLENDGDMEKAADFLRKKGLAAANKRAGRAAKEGIVIVKEDGSKTIMLELNCETDFVAKNEDFTKLANSILDEIDNSGLDKFDKDNLPSSVEDLVKNSIATTGENQSVGGFSKFEITDGKEGIIAVYIHNNKKIGVMVELNCASKDAAGKEEFKSLGYELAMQVAAANPQWVSPDEVPAENVSREKDIYMDQMKDSGKPENVLEKIVEGKLQKYYSEVCLLNQEYIKESKMKIKDLIKKVSTEIGEDISVARFVRYQIGA